HRAQRFARDRAAMARAQPRTARRHRAHRFALDGDPFISNHKAASWPGLSWQVGFTRLAAVNSAQLGQARVAVPSTSSFDAQKTWMPATSAGMTKQSKMR